MALRHALLMSLVGLVFVALLGSSDAFHLRFPMRQLLGPTNWATNENDDDAFNATEVIDRRHGRRHLASTIGTFKALVLLVRFTDHADKELPPRDHYQWLCEDQLKTYFAEQSYGQYNLECDVKDWATTDNTEAHYAAGVSNYQGADLSAGMFIPILNQLDAAGTDWAPYDADLNGDLDAVLVIHSGHASEQGPGTNCGAPDPANRIYSQGHSVSMAWTSASYTTYLSGYAIASAYDRVCPGTQASMGVMAHEMTHTFGTPDLYHLGEGGGSLGGIGLYDIMSNSFGPNMDGNPASMSAFTKSLIGWVTPTEITVDGTYTIRLLLNHADAYVIKKGFAADEYLLIENRGNANRDTGLPGAGLLIYHVDNAVLVQDSPGFPGQDGWPQNGKHFRLAVLPADGKYDLEQFVNNGDAGDYWTSGMTLGPGNNGQTYPNTDSYQGGNIVSTGITISDISAAGDTMTFTVSGLGSDGSVPTAPTGSTSTPPPGMAPTMIPTATGAWVGSAPTPGGTAMPTVWSAEVVDDTSYPPTTPYPTVSAVTVSAPSSSSSTSSPTAATVSLDAPTTPSPTALATATATTATPTPPGSLAATMGANDTSAPTALSMNATMAPTASSSSSSSNVTNSTTPAPTPFSTANSTMEPTGVGNETTAPSVSAPVNETDAIDADNTTTAVQVNESDTTGGEPIDATSRNSGAASVVFRLGDMALFMSSLLWVL